MQSSEEKSKTPVADTTVTVTSRDEKQDSTNRDQTQALKRHSGDEFDPFEVSLNTGKSESQPSSNRSSKLGKPPTGFRAVLHSLKGWWAELAWLLLSIGSLIALVMVLRSFDGKKLPKLANGITLNTIIALLSTACRSAFIGPVMEAVAQSKWVWFKTRGRPLQDYAVFEKASRGPGGSLKLVMTTKARYAELQFILSTP
jgi:hypothetical protein